MEEEPPPSEEPESEEEPLNRAGFLWLLRLGLAGLYLFAAIPKIIDPWSFARAIMNFRILPRRRNPSPRRLASDLRGRRGAGGSDGAPLSRWRACALGNVGGASRLGIASAMLRGLDIDCGCFGSAARSRANLGHLALNLASLAAGITLLAARARTRRRLPRRI